MFKFFDIQDVVDSAPAFVGNLLFYDVTASENRKFLWDNLPHQTRRQLAVPSPRTIAVNQKKFKY